jgi:hypothetical protein
MNLTVHNVYFCFSEVGCTISLRDGTPCKEVPAHTPTLFVAQQPDMVCSDPAAVVKEIPNGLQLLHGQMMKEQSAGKLKYAACVTVDDMRAVNPDYKNDLTSDGEWVYPLPKLVNIGGYQSSLFHNAKNLKKATLVLPKATNISYLFFGCTELEEAYVVAPSANNATHILQDTTNRPSLKFKVVLENIENLDNFLWNFKQENLELHAPKMTSGDFVGPGWGGSELNKKSALSVFSNVSADAPGSRRLRIGIHIDLQNDDEVLAAIANAEAKGWALTVQWNGTPTAQAATTYGLRKPPIYARVSELENGERFVDWGHYVTDPTGYEEFRSVAAAREYFGLPAEDLINN